MGKHTIMVIFGTRPEAIKMCPLIIELKKHLELNVIVCVTGQHRELLDQVLDCFGVPTIGLDIGTKEAMRELIQRINRERGVTIILTSHDLKDVENICQRIIVIDDGRVVCDKGIHSLAKEYSMDRGLLLTLSETQQGLLEKVRSLDGISYAVMEDAYTLEIDFQPEQHTAFELVKEVGQYAQIQDFKLKEPSIERMIEKIYLAGGENL